MLVREVQKTPQTIYTIAIALGCLTEFEHITLLLKTPNTLYIELAEIDLTWNHLLC